jgi:2-polyprenyl-3-methyl-5-hydroxy-6-metoxy-1,4-benzoquinol methylase
LSTNTEVVREFYNEFLSKRMVGYRLYGNIRVSAAADFFAEQVGPSSVVVDVGCGIGIASEVMAKKARSGRVIGVDLSDQNIWYAGKTVDLPNVEFHALDIVADVDRLRSLLRGSPVDIFTLGDVIEHVPEVERSRLFETMAALGSPGVKILITIPSEFYQRYLMTENPAELQIIDNVITPTLLEAEGRKAGFALTYFRLLDMWKPVQYAHCALARASSLTGMVRGQVTPRQPPNAVLRYARRALNRVERVITKLIVQPRRYRKYVTNVFSDQDRRRLDA